MINLFKNKALEQLIKYKKSELSLQDNKSMQTFIKEIYIEYLAMLTTGNPLLLEDFPEGNLSSSFKNLKLNLNTYGKESYSKCDKYILTNEDSKFYVYSSRYNIKVAFNKEQSAEKFISDCILSDIRIICFERIKLELLLNPKEDLLDYSSMILDLINKLFTVWGLEASENEINSFTLKIITQHKETFL